MGFEIKGMNLGLAHADFLARVSGHEEQHRKGEPLRTAYVDAFSTGTRGKLGDLSTVAGQKVTRAWFTFADGILERIGLQFQEDALKDVGRAIVEALEAKYGPGKKPLLIREWVWKMPGETMTLTAPKGDWPHLSIESDKYVRLAEDERARAQAEKAKAAEAKRKANASDL